MASASRAVRRISAYLPRIGLSALILCLGSGIVLAFYYRPMGNVFQSVEEITSLVPYGWFFRQLHYGAGQVCVFLMLLHTLDHFVRRRYRMYAIREWIGLITSLVLCFVTLFTGFVLKGDQEGIFAGQIFMHILEAVPVVGGAFARLFIEPGDGFFFLPYLYHCFFLPLLIIYLMGSHIRDWFPDLRFLLSGGMALLIYALFVKPAVDIPPGASVPVVTGPWFFLGIQTLLKTLPPFLAGFLLPALFVGSLLVLPSVASLLRRAGFGKRAASRVEDVFYGVLIATVGGYALLTLWAGIWGP